MSRDGGDEVRQTVLGRIAYLTFQSYQQSQGGKYECRVSGPENNLEKLPVCIGECYPLGVAVNYVHVLEIARTVNSMSVTIISVLK